MTQAQALTILKTGANVFLTGEPGSGKTHTINQYVAYLRDHGIEPAITASTGIAATHIHGQTIHSWSGIGIRRFLSPYDLDAIATTEYIVRRIRNTAVLIIDEISMIDATTLDLVDAVCREVRASDEPFGGLQVVLVGDFFQLPPVANRGETVRFAFESNVWMRMKPLVCYLSEQHRQEDDAFLSVLNAIRRNEYDEYHHELLEARKLSAESEIENHENLTRLFPHNMNVDLINSAELGKLNGVSMRYDMEGKGSAALVANLKKGCLSPEVLELKLGSVVMCTKNNVQKGYANGTLGVVKGFETGTRFPIIETRTGETITVEPVDWNIEDNGKIKAMIRQVPLRLAWAITVHKSQGMSLDAAVMDLAEAFEYGQGYVALSRVRTLSGLYLLGWNRQAFMVHPKISAIDQQFLSHSEAAALTFADMPDERLREMQERFILAAGGSITKKKKLVKKDTAQITKDMILEGNDIAAIATVRELTEQTIAGHIEKLVDAGELAWNQIEILFSPQVLSAVSDVEKAMKKKETTQLGILRTQLKNKYSFETIKLALIIIKARP